jgi:hypothetical protein
VRIAELTKWTRSETLRPTISLHFITYSKYIKKAPALKTLKVADKLALLGLLSKPEGRESVFILHF